MLTIKRLSECTWEEATKAWNRGFEGYYFDATSTVERFAHRIGMEGLSPALSVVGFVDGEPVGLVLSGVRTIDGKKVAWNGGTGVATEFRRQGVGRKLMEALLSLYREEGVDIATLEAFRQNEKAIALYQQMGYKIVDHLLFLQTVDVLPLHPFGSPEDQPYRIQKGIPHDVRALSFYHSMAPWQTQWAGIRDGEALVAQDTDGQTAGYALFKRTFDEAGKLASIVLMQCAADPSREDGEAVVRCLLSHVFAPFEYVCRRTTFNFPARHQLVVHVLEQAGFQPSTEQVYMMLHLKP